VRSCQGRAGELLVPYVRGPIVGEEDMREAESEEETRRKKRVKKGEEKMPGNGRRRGDVEVATEQKPTKERGNAGSGEGAVARRRNEGRDTEDCKYQYG
jgi:hypothetical protein